MFRVIWDHILANRFLFTIYYPMLFEKCLLQFDTCGPIQMINFPIT